MRRLHPGRDLRDIASAWGRAPREPKGAPIDDHRHDEELVPDPAWARRRPVARARTALQQGLVFPVLWTVGRPEVLGTDDLDTYPQPAVIAPNHASHVDTSLILYALPRSWRANTVVAAASDHFYDNKAVGAAVSLLFNTVPFERRGRLRGLRTTERLLSEGWNVVMFPQGSRQAEGALDDFHPGVGRTCLRSGVPAVPVWISGTGRMMPPGRGLPRPTRLRIAFGRPVYAEDGDDYAAFAARLESAVKALAGADGRHELIGRPPVERWRASSAEGRHQQADHESAPQHDQKGHHQRSQAAKAGRGHLGRRSGAVP